MKTKTKLHEWFLKFDRTLSEKKWWRTTKTNMGNMFYTLKLFFSNFHLLIARTLAEGRWSRFLMLFINFIILTLGTSIVLFFAYGGICLEENVIKYGDHPYEPVNVFDAAYYLLFTNGGQNLYIGSHWVGIAITSFGILFIAVLTSMFTNYFERVGQNYLSGESTFLMKNHVVIIGTHDVLYSILNSKMGNKKTHFLIMTSKDVIQKRREILSFIDNQIDNNQIVFMYGDRTSGKDINRLSLAYAKEVFIIGDSEEIDSIEPYRDSNNMDCVELIAENPAVEKLRNDNNKLPCHVMFEYQTTFVAFQFSKMGDSYKEHIDFLPFNFYDMWAQKILVAGETDKKGEKLKYEYLDTLPNGCYIDKNSEKSVHLIVIGITKMGVALGIQAAQICHFPNFISDNSKRTRITFIDAEADVEFNYMNGRYNNLFNIARHRIVDLSSDKNESELKESELKEQEKPWDNDNSWLDVEWEFIKGRVESPNVQTYIKDCCEDKSHIVTLAVCLTRSHQSIATAMFLPTSVFENCLQILVYQRLSGTIIDTIAKSDTTKEQYRYNKLRPFGMIDCGYDPKFEKEINNQAKYIAYVYDSYYRTTIGNKEIMAWDERLVNFNDIFLSWVEYSSYEDFWSKKKQVWEKISCQLNSLSIRTKLRSIGVLIPNNRECSIENISSIIDNEIGNMQIVEHNRWNMEKLLTGYRALTDEERHELNELWDAWHNPHLSEDEKENQRQKWANKRKQLKEWPHRAHLDLCSFDVLKTCEEETILTHDIKLNAAIPYILQKENIITTTKQPS